MVIKGHCKNVISAAQIIMKNVIVMVKAIMKVLSLGKGYCDQVILKVLMFWQGVIEKVLSLWPCNCGPYMQSWQMRQVNVLCHLDYVFVQSCLWIQRVIILFKWQVRKVRQSKDKRRVWVGNYRKFINNYKLDPTTMTDWREVRRAMTHTHTWTTNHPNTAFPHPNSNNK